MNLINQKIIFLLLLLVNSEIFSQCDAIPIVFPMEYTFCTEDCIIIQQPNVVDCWQCVANYINFEVTVGNGTPIVVNALYDLDSYVIGNNAIQVGQFMISEGCPFDGGDVLFRPWLWDGGSCWNWDILETYCSNSPIPNINNLGCWNSNPPYLGSSPDMEFYFYLPSGTYYFTFFMGSACPFAYACDTGCIYISFEGVNFLDLTPFNPPQSQNQISVYQPRYSKVVIEGKGMFIFDRYDSTYYDIQTKQHITP
jgi:hypothetical protein